jgi:hypothetical protein
MRQQARRQRRWAIPFYLIATPFVGVVVYSAWQVLRGAGPHIALITLGQSHLKPLLVWGGASVVSFFIAWRLDRSYLSFDAAPTTQPALPAFEAIEEPTMILHAQAIEAGPIPSVGWSGERDVEGMGGNDVDYSPESAVNSDH